MKVKIKESRSKLTSFPKLGEFFTHLDFPASVFISTDILHFTCLNGVVAVNIRTGFSSTFQMDALSKIKLVRPIGFENDTLIFEEV